MGIVTNYCKDPYETTSIMEKSGRLSFVTSLEIESISHETSLKHPKHFRHYLGKIPILTNIFQQGWNHQLG